MKCIEPGCENHDHQGTFIGEYCYPCFKFYEDIASGRLTSFYSQAYLNKREEARQLVLKQEANNEDPT